MCSVHPEEQPLVTHYLQLHLLQPVHPTIYSISVIKPVCVCILEQYRSLSVKAEQCYYTTVQLTHVVTLRSTTNIPIMNVGHVQKKGLTLMC